MACTLPQPSVQQDISPSRLPMELPARLPVLPIFPLLLIFPLLCSFLLLPILMLPGILPLLGSLPLLPILPLLRNLPLLCSLPLLPTLPLLVTLPLLCSLVLLRPTSLVLLGSPLHQVLWLRSAQEMASWDLRCGDPQSCFIWCTDWGWRTWWRSPHPPPTLTTNGDMRPESSFFSLASSRRLLNMTPSL